MNSLCTVACCSVLLGNISIGRAAVVVDQIFDPRPFRNYPESGGDQLAIASGYFGGEGISWAQTFTVGVSGYLVGVSALLQHVAGPDPLLVEIRRTSPYGVPLNDDDSVLARVSAVPETFPIPEFSFSAEFIYLDLGTHLAISVGEVLALVVRSPSPPTIFSGTGYQWEVTNGSVDRYPGGTLFIRGEALWEYPTSWTLPSGGDGYSDAAFVTFVERVPMAVPLPLTTVAVLALALASCAAMGLSTDIRQKPACSTAG